MTEDIKFERLDREVESVLINTFNYYRLLRDYVRVEEKIRKNEPTDYTSDSALKKMWKKNVVNPMRQANTSGLSGKKKEISDRIDAFLARVPKENLDEAAAKDAALLKEKTESVFADDGNGTRRMFFALTLYVVGNTETYVDRDGTLADVSEILYGNDTRMAELASSLSENYAALNGKGFTDLEKGLIAGTGLALLVASIAVPAIALGKAAGSACIAGVLSQIGPAASGAVVAGAVAVEQATVIAGVSLLGVTLLGSGIERTVREQKTRAAFRKLSPNDLKFLLAVNATLLQQLKPTMSEEQFKNSLNGCLEEIDFLRADAQYLLLVERISAGDTKAKIETCNRMISRMATIVGI